MDSQFPGSDDVKDVLTMSITDVTVSLGQEASLQVRALRRSHNSAAVDTDVKAVATDVRGRR
jgi:hypothetical protein